jgi:hypothetical protein
MGVGRTLYRSANPVHGFVLNVFRARARAQCSGARNQSMGAIAKRYPAYEPFNCEHEHRPWRRTEHEHDVFGSHPSLSPRQAGCSIKAERREPSGGKRSGHGMVLRASTRMLAHLG